MWVLLLGFSSFRANAQCNQATISSIKSGNFSSPDTWNLNRMPNSCDKILINHSINLDNNIPGGEFFLGSQNAGEITISTTGSLISQNNAKLRIKNNNSRLINNGSLTLTSFEFGVNGLVSDSAFLENNGTATFSNIVSFQRGSISNSNRLTLNVSDAELNNITLENSAAGTITFQNKAKLNSGSKIINRGNLNILGTNNEALTFNSGRFYNYGTTALNARAFFASGPSQAAFNNLYNYGSFTAKAFYLNNLASIKNWGRLICTQEFRNAQGKVTNYSCGYLEQTQTGYSLINQNSGAQLTNDGFIKVNGNFMNDVAQVNGSGTFHIYGQSSNRNQASIAGTLCIYDFSKGNAGLIVDENINQSTIASTVSTCATATAPTCPPTGTVSSCIESDACFDFIYKGYVVNKNNTVTLTIGIRTNCNQDLSHAAFELPAGAVATNPVTANQAFSYSIENPTNNPYYSLKFNGVRINGYKRGEEDDFSYTLTDAEFNALSTFRVTAKAGTTVGTVTLNAKLGIQGPAAVCTNTSQTFSVNPLSGATSYFWQIPAGWTLTSGQGTNSITVTPNGSPGNVKVEAANWCSTKEVAILPATLPAPGSITGPGQVCPNTTYYFEVPPVANAAFYHWQVPAGWQILSPAIGNGYDAKILVQTGNSTGNITVAAAHPCATSAITTKSVNQDLVIPFTSGITGEANPCTGSTESYSISALNGSNFTWTVPAGYTLLSGQGTNSISVLVGSGNGNLEVTASSPLGCSTASANLAITPATVPAIKSNPQAIIINRGSNTSFKVSSGGRNLTFQWQVNSGNGWSTISNNGIYQTQDSVLQISNAPIYLNGYQYRVILSNCNQSVTSSSATLTVNQTGIAANIKVLLEGPYNPATGLMRTTLNAANLLPTDQPFNNAFWKYTGTENVPPGFFAANPTVVDWVMVELRTNTLPNSKVLTQAFLLKNDGKIVDLDGRSLPSFPGVQPGSYYLIVHHRNHLSVMSKTLVVLNTNPGLYDFTTTYKAASGINPVKKMADGKWVLYTGDANANGSVTTSDWGSYWVLENGQNGYLKSDWNLDGTVNQTDYNYWYTNGGFTTQVLR